MSAPAIREYLHIISIDPANAEGPVCGTSLDPVTPAEEDALHHMRNLYLEASKVRMLYRRLEGLLSAELERDKLQMHIARLRQEADQWRGRFLAAQHIRMVELGHSV